MDHRIRQLAQSMSDPSFGMDETDYFQHCREVMANSGWTLMEIREACRVKYKWLRAEYLINKIRDGSGTAPAEAIIMLLEENFKP